MYFRQTELPYIHKGHLVKVGRFLAIEGVLHQRGFLHSRTFLAGKAGNELTTLDGIQLLLLQVRHEQLTADKVHNLSHIPVLAGDGDIEIGVVASVCHRGT